MGENSKIEWTDHTLNPWIGCTKVSPGCDHCYAEAMMDHRYGRVQWGPHGERKRTSDAIWRKPLQWNRNADAFEAEHGRRQRVFCASLADVFDNQVPAEWRADLWEMIRACDRLDWLLLTKRPQNIRKMLPPDWGNGWAHVWLGTTAENQGEADRRIPGLLATPAAVRFLSAEPLLGPISLAGSWLRQGDNGRWPFDRQIGTGIDWVIVGGESGPGARPMHPAWARSIRDQCAAAGVAFHFKQHGEWIEGQEAFRRDIVPIEERHPWGICQPAMARVGKSRAGRLLDGIQHDGFPEAGHG